MGQIWEGWAWVDRGKLGQKPISMLYDPIKVLKVNIYQHIRLLFGKADGVMCGL